MEITGTEVEGEQQGQETHLELGNSNLGSTSIVRRRSIKIFRRRRSIWGFLPVLAGAIQPSYGVVYRWRRHVVLAVRRAEPEKILEQRSFQQGQQAFTPPSPQKGSRLDG
jgi:hypothetical protein